ncbi:MAG: hypothetical protein ACR2L2_06020 [Acidobacteriota bacterium]
MKQASGSRLQAPDFRRNPGIDLISVPHPLTDNFLVFLPLFTGHLNSHFEFRAELLNSVDKTLQLLAGGPAGTVTHHVRASLRSGEVGMDYVRPYEFAGEQLLFRYAVSADDGERRTRVIVWRRAERF